MWIERSKQLSIKELSKSRPVILLTGARQTGKSSLLLREFPDAEYVTFDHLRNVEAASESPDFFLNQLDNHDTVILDEIQYVPGLFRELKARVDRERKRYGKWILTGSRHFELMKDVSESLAGRISIIHLETLSAAELRAADIESFPDFVWKGGYPELWSNPLLNTDDFFESYLRTYIERDLKSIIDIRNLHDFKRLIRVLAVRVGQLINYTNISNEVGVSDVTVRKWVHALGASGILYLLPPYHANIGKRLTRSPKIYFSDHGLLCHLLGVDGRESWNAHTHRGNIWENIVFMEMVKAGGMRPGERLFFYRDQNGVEIDFIIEKKNELVFIEAKASERVEERQVNFRKVMPLFAAKWKTSAVLLQNIPDGMILKRKEYLCLNPLLADIPF